MATAVPPATGSPPPKSTGPLPMTRGRVAALVIGVPACLALVGATGFSNLASFAEGSSPAGFTVPSTTKALTLNVTGNLTIRPTTARRVTFTGTATYTFVRAAPTERTSAGATTIGYNCPISTGECGLNGTVTVPKSVTTLTSNTAGGDATVAGTTGPVNLSTGGGNLSVSDASGPVTLTADGGSIQVTAFTGATLSASTGGGSIKVTSVRSKTITANTDGGNIVESGIKASTVTASTGGGDIKITFTGDPHDVHVDTDGGYITLVLPDDATQYKVSANDDVGGDSVQVGTGIESASSPNVITASSGGDGIVSIQRA